MTEPMNKYTYYAKQQGACVPLFTLFAEREPTKAEARAFFAQVKAQTRQLALPKPEYLSVEVLTPFDMGEETKVIPVNGNGTPHEGGA